ncbi:hypothetical protein [Paenibacillus sp. MMO-177]|uniref:hypothetical protein n=1 Tax=Paenibacillus sp. MMO-177 TaxID=3081289 RepID=UPI00301AB30A
MKGIVEVFKKLLISTIIASSLFAGVAVANRAPHVETVKIESVSYSEADGVFYVYGEKDKSGSFWVVDFKPKKGESLEQFQKRVVGRTLVVKYVEDEQYDDVEIVGKFIW